MTAKPLPADARVHLVGIGGAGMSALAQLLLERGMAVSGSDLGAGGATDALRALGASIAIGHRAEHVGDVDLVVVSSAVPGSNAEVLAARDRGLPVILRAELLERLMVGARRILVTGTHGKTTTSSMVTAALRAAGLDPSFAIGGVLADAGTSAHAGTGPFVAEADEAYRSFLHLTADLAVVTNVEMDHHDEYEGYDDVVIAFEAFLDRRPPGAPALCCIDDAGAAALAARARGPVLTYGTAEGADHRVTDVVLRADGSELTLVGPAGAIGRFTVGVPGHHNVLNAAAAITAAVWAGADPDGVREGLASFRGALRRFQRLGTAAGVSVVDDYGHHPTEVRATLAAARQTRPAGRVVAVFQPHRVSRTAALWRELGAALADADLVVVTDVYAAGEPPQTGITGERVAEAAAAAGAEVRYVPALVDLPRALVRLVAPGDLVLTMGAGDITAIGPQLLRRLEAGP